MKTSKIGIILSAVVLLLGLLSDPRTGEAHMTSQTERHQPSAVSPVGSWEWQGGQIVLQVVFNADGTGSFNSQAIKWQLQGGVMTLNDGFSTVRYNASLAADSLTLSGGNLPQALTFRRTSDKAIAGGDAPSEESGPVGSWEREAGDKRYRLVIQADGTGALDGMAFQWAFDQGSLRLTVGKDVVTYKASFAENTMTLAGASQQQPTIWKRLAASGAQGKAQSGTGLVGKWQGPDG